MKRFILVFILSLSIFGVVIQSSFKRSSAPVQEQSTLAVFPLDTQTDAQGAVTVGITPLNINSTDETLDFEVQMNTHSVELDMNLATLATLTTDTGIEVKAVSWDAPSGGHHASGKLTFPASVNGIRLNRQNRSLTLTIQDVDTPERTFKWEIKQ
jgi:hypothetical protein